MLYRDKVEADALSCYCCMVMLTHNMFEIRYMLCIYRNRQDEADAQSCLSRMAMLTRNTFEIRFSWSS